MCIYTDSLVTHTHTHTHTDSYGHWLTLRCCTMRLGSFWPPVNASPFVMILTPSATRALLSSVVSCMTQHSIITSSQLEAVITYPRSARVLATNLIYILMCGGRRTSDNLTHASKVTITLFEVTVLFAWVEASPKQMQVGPVLKVRIITVAEVDKYWISN